MARDEIKGWYVLLIGDKKNLTDNAQKTKEKLISILKLLNKIEYNEMILTQECTVYFHIVEKSKTKSNKYRYARQVWINFQEILIQTQGLPR